MMQTVFNKTNLKLLALFLVLVGVVLVFLTAPIGAQEQYADDVIAGTGEVGTGSGSRITSVIRTLLTLLSWVSGVIAVIMLIVSGVRMTVSNGDPQKVSGARNGIIYALVGLVVVIMSQVIVRFVLNNINS